MPNSRRNSAELAQLLRKPSNAARRVSMVSQSGSRWDALWTSDQPVDVVVEPLNTPQAIHIEETTDGDGTLDRVRNILLADEDAEAAEPRPLFCELLILRSTPADDAKETAGLIYTGSQFWQESSRWIKFEETVEEGGSRWSKPHVTLLNVSRLLQIRSCLQKHATLLDVNALSFGHVVELLTGSWIKKHLLNEEEQRAVKDALMSPKRHLVKTRVRSELSTPYDDNASDNLSEGVPSPQATVTSTNGLATELKLAKNAINQSLFRKLPEYSEAACVFVGYVASLRYPVSEFVRLSRANIFNDVTELPIPTRFIFVLLLPIDHPETKLTLLGRCMGALFVDEVFSRICYKARHGYELAYAIDEFLSQTIIIPPEKWNPKSRLEPPENFNGERRAKKLQQSEKKLSALPLTYDDHTPQVQRTGRLFGGLIEDIKCKLPWYVSDYTDVTKGRVSQTLAAAIFLFFANISKIITFGGVMGSALEDQIGAIENVLAGGVCGVIYALFSGQPLCVLSATGPCLVFEVILFNLSKSMGWSFLVVRCWVGLWTAVVLMFMVAFDSSVLVSMITRFTEEAFATMISIIFLIKAIEELLEVGKEYPVMTNATKFLEDSCRCLSNASFDFENGTYPDDPHAEKSLFMHNFTDVNNSTNRSIAADHKCHEPVPDVFLFSVILFFATFFIAFALKLLRHSPFFPSKVRQVIADFNVTIAIFVMSLVNMLSGLNVPRLEVPSKFQPTDENRLWVINPFLINPWWLAVVTIFPALFFSILVSLDQNITSVIINRKDNKLQKGCGYHLDLAVIAFLMIICSIFGIPFYVAATVISLMHVESLRLTSETVAPGEKPQFLGLREQRVTALIAHLLIGLSVFLTPIMRHLPMPVLLGVFLYMGIVSLAGQQFVTRILILFMPAKHQPDLPWLRLVRLRRVNIFTVIQMVSLIFLMLVEEIKLVSMAFPLMLVVMIFIRKFLLERVFTKKELFALDDPLPTFAEIFRSKRSSHQIVKCDVKKDDSGLRHPSQPKIVVSISS